MAALVPAHRALTWQLTDGSGTGIVRERNWLSFQPGEIRVCANCHGINTQSQTGDVTPGNEPEALRDLLIAWQQTSGGGGTPGVPTATPTHTPGGGATPTRTSTPVPTATPTPATGGDPCADGVAAQDARLRTVTASGAITMTGSAAISAPALGIDPLSDGLRLTIVGTSDVVVPGGEGWTRSGGGKRWRFVDASGAHGGIRRIDVADRSSRSRVRLTYSVHVGGSPASPPLGAVDAHLTFGDDTCVLMHWNAPDGPKPRCQGSAARVSCR
jgi:hypothetical protein